MASRPMSSQLALPFVPKIPLGHNQLQDVHESLPDTYMPWLVTTARPRLFDRNEVPNSELHPGSETARPATVGEFEPEPVTWGFAPGSAPRPWPWASQHWSQPELYAEQAASAARRVTLVSRGVGPARKELQGVENRPRFEPPSCKTMAKVLVCARVLRGACWCSRHNQGCSERKGTME